jgi:hypothetical protein
MTGDRLIRAGTAAAVLLVAVIAAVVSYQHLYHLAITHGETRMDAALLPLSIDGTVVTGSLLMLRAARLGLGTPWLARGMLAVAVIMTIAANVAFGWPYAAWGILMAGWPAAAFLLNAEGSISFGRKARGTARVHPAAQVAQDAEQAAQHALAASITAGNPLSQRQLMARFGLSRAQATRVRDAVHAGANGHSPSDSHSGARPVTPAQRAGMSPRDTAL